MTENSFDKTIRMEMHENVDSIIKYHNNNYNEEIPDLLIAKIRDVINTITWKAHLFINHSDNDYTGSAIIMCFYSNTGFGTLEFVFYFNGITFAQIIDNDLYIDTIGRIDYREINDTMIRNFMRTGSITPTKKSREKTGMVLVDYDRENPEKFQEEYYNAQCKLEQVYKYRILNSDFYTDWFYEMNMSKDVIHPDLYIVSRLIAVMSKCDAVYVTKSFTKKKNLFNMILFNTVQMMSNITLIYEGDE